MTVSDSSNQQKQGENNSFAVGCFEWIEALITALIAVMILFVFFSRLNIVVEGPSMEPNYYQGYRVFVNCADRNFTRGDVVVIDAAGTKLNTRIIKRVIATEGQTVNIDSSAGYVYVDGKKLDESAYIHNGITRVEGDGLTPMQFPLTVPKGKIFVLGDHRDVSEDSRYAPVGLIDARYVMGKVPFLLSPFRGFTAK